MITNKQKALIHIAKQKVGMSDEEYRDLLGGFGVTSSKDLTHGKFDSLMTHFKGLGFRQAPGKPYKQLHPIGSKKRLLYKIEAQITEMNLSWKYVDGMAKKMFGVDRMIWCVPQQLHKIVAALNYHQKRIEKKKVKGRAI
jgi:phage gp16-like protein